MDGKLLTVESFVYTNLRDSFSIGFVYERTRWFQRVRKEKRTMQAAGLLIDLSFTEISEIQCRDWHETHINASGTCSISLSSTMLRYY